LPDSHAAGPAGNFVWLSPPRTISQPVGSAAFSSYEGYIDPVGFGYIVELARNVIGVTHASKAQ